jgi:putative oxidoreductase
MMALNESWQKWSPQVLSLVRIVAAACFFEYGLEKYFGFPEAGPKMNALLYVQGVIEIVGGLLLLFGAYTRIVFNTAAAILAHLVRVASSTVTH